MTTACRDANQIGSDRIEPAFVLWRGVSPGLRGTLWALRLTPRNVLLGGP